MTHTPGPWSFYNAYGTKHVMFTRLGNADDTILEAARANVETWINSEDDARLIAAAPDLLEACELMLDAWESYEMLAGLDYHIQDLARAAIAKAKGEQL